MRKIDNLTDLRKEKARLNLELAAYEEQLHEDVQWIKQELNPVKVAGKLVSNAMLDKNHGVLNEGLRGTVDFVLKNLVLSKAGWITKLVVPFVVKNISSNYLLEKKPEIFGMLRNLIRKAREGRKDQHHKQNGSHTYYDKSTVDEMDY